MEIHLNILLRGIELEEQEERKRYLLDGGASLKLLKNSGLAIHPIRITRKSFGYLDYPEISFSTPFPSDAGGFRDGCAIEGFCSGEESVKGMLLFFDGKKGGFRLFAPDFPDWIEDDGVGIKVAPDVRTTQRMKESVQAISFSKRLSNLFERIHSDTELSTTQSATFPILEWENKHLNESQQQAISEIVFGTDAIRIVHGPPGTGKTTTLIEAVHQLCKQNKRILISAPSNAAVDHFAQQLHRKHPKIEILRIGNNTKVTEAILPITPEGKLKNSKEEKEVKRLKIQAEELRRMAHQYKRHFGKEERDQRNLILKEVKQLRKQIRDIQAYNEEKLFEKAQVILGTPMGISDEFKDSETTFDKLIIDEAGQCLEPLAWSIIPFSEQIILAGDHFQLPPTLLSQEALQLGFNKSILEVCTESLTAFNLLNVQYRMKQPIAEFSNRYFYEGKVQTDTPLQTAGEHLFFYDTAGADCAEESGEGGTSLQNPGEASAITKLIRHFELPPKHTVLISPYTGQVSLLRELFPEFKVRTIDSYQGQEAENVIISLVRSNQEGNIGFLNDYRRMNVAMTRAQEKLFVVGDSATLGSDPFYGQFLDYLESIQAYRSVWELVD
jgi:ATP-dependent RNA/DNA helicase IGHMBP2